MPTILTTAPCETATSNGDLVTTDAELERRIAAGDPTLQVLTGDRPTGPLHLGHLVGSLQNRVRLQRLGVPVTVVVADYQVITDRTLPGPVVERTLGLVADQLAAGLDPETTVFFPHSAVPALNQLLLPFLSLIGEQELRRNPTVKAEAAAGTSSALLLTYPVHQACDILALEGTLVPVGRDQLPHLELARTIVRRLADRHGCELALPSALLSATPVLPGTDGMKMSKSRGNTVPLSATADETAALIRRAVTDAERVITYDPEARPGVAALLQIGAAATGQDPRDLAEEIGGAGAAQLKRVVTTRVNDLLAPIRGRRREVMADPGALRDLLVRGTVVARETAGRVLDRVHSALGLQHF